MTPDQQKEFMRKSFTLQGRVLYPNLLVARARKEGDRETFDGQFTWTIGSNPQVMAEINNFLQAATNGIHPGLDPRALVNPIKRFDTYLRQDGKKNADHLNNCYWVNASSGKDFPPQVVDSNRQPLINAADLYSGRNVVFNISFYAIIPKPGATNQKRGFGVNVGAVMLMEGGEKVGGIPTVDVNQIFGSFQADSTPVQQQQTYAQQPTQQAAAPQWPPVNNQAPSNGGGFV
jgi:hypothetical protein